MEIHQPGNPIVRTRAFTLLELLLVVGIISILMILLFPAAKSIYASSTDAVSAHVISQLNAAAQSYLAENNQTYWAYSQTNNGGTQWWVGFDSTASLHSPEGSRWVDLLTLHHAGQVPVSATCAQVNTFQAPASAKHPMAEEFYYFNATEKTVHFRIGGNAMVGYADGSAGYLPMMPGTLDSRLPAANIGRLEPSLITP